VLRVFKSELNASRGSTICDVPESIKADGLTEGEDDN